MNKVEELYSGKAKSLFTTEDPQLLIAEFRDDTSAFDGEKIEQLAHKGAVNNQFSAFIMQNLQEAGIATHFVEVLTDTSSLVKKLEMIPVECVVRNVAAGGLCRRLGIEQGLEFNPPLFEMFLKNDALHDPMITEEHIRAFGYAKLEEIRVMRQLSFSVNDILRELFSKAGIILVDFKLEFGRYQGKLVLGDEFTPDGCRLWDKETKAVFDKDRFRKNMGNVVESYELVAERLGVKISY